MEVIRNADIARLVLGYLRDQNLEKVADIFCKCSPYLRDEYRLKRKGIRLISLGSGHLIHILKEYSEIKSKVAQFTETLPSAIRNIFIKHSTLSDRISLILEEAKKALESENEQAKDKSNLKRRRPMDSTDSFDIEATKIQDLPGYSPILKKRRRLSGSYLFLDSVTELQESSMSSESEANSNNSNSNRSDHLTNSTESKLPRVPSIPIISETLLEKPLFHNKLAENINKALQNSAKKQSPEKTKGSGETPNDTLTKQLDDMIKNIMDATENDPTFDEIVKEVVYTTAINKSLSMNNKSTQVSPKNVEETTNDKHEEDENMQSGEADNLQSSTSSNPEITSPKICVTVPSHAISIPPQGDAVTGDSLQNTAANNSLNISLFDPSLSISKLIVLNPNESFATQLTSEQIISAPSLSNIQGFSSLSEQVVIDINTGQMTIPLSVANTGIDIPVFINTNAEQGLAEENPAVDTSLVEKIRFSEDQTLVSVGTSTLEENTTKSAHLPVQTKFGENTNVTTITMPASLDSRVAIQKATPSTSKIIPQTIRSLSTPRRTTSHVRVLNFSTPLKASVDNVKVKNENIISTELAPKAYISNACALEKGQEKNREEIVHFKEAQKSKAVESSIQVTTENSNSNSLDFAVDKSNETVIIRNISETPKRRTDNKKCVRNLSQSTKSREDQSQEVATSVKVGTSKGNSRNEVKKPRQRIYRRRKEEPPEQEMVEDNLDPMEQWQKMRTAVNNKNFDQHLRQIASKNRIPQPRSSKIKRRRRRIVNKSVTEDQASINGTNDENQAEQSFGSNKSDNLENKSDTNANTSQPEVKTTADIEASVKKLINIKISSPLKHKKGKNILNKSVEIKKKQKEQKDKEHHENDSTAKSSIVELRRNVGNSTTALEITPKVPDLQTDENVPSLIEDGDDQIIKVETKRESSSIQEQKSEARDNFQKKIVHREMEKRTANIAHLLETPFKDIDPSSCPFTPRFLIPEAQDTPITKLMNSIRQVSAAKNFDIPTPSIAITPGASLTPKEKETPRSGYRSSYATDYSSGGSYYKPDESEDLDKHLDQILIAERQNRKVTEKEKHNSKVSTTQNESTEIVLETKKIPVPAVLQRVKSFSDEVPSVIPHYTFVEGLPENTYDSSSSDSSSSTTSSSSSSSDSTSSKSRVSLSDIDSSEDEEWKQQSVEIVNEQFNENSLITEDGEVRYPVRSWITPKKSDPDSPSKTEPKPGTSLVNARQLRKIDEDKSKQLTDLEEKRLRIKEKLKEDLPNKDKKQSVKIIKRERLMVTRTIIRKPEKTTPGRKNPPPVNKISPPSRENSKDVPYKADSQVDMLKALNLSKRSMEVESSSKEVDKSFTALFVSPNSNAIKNDGFPCTEEISKDSEADQVRKAALALTTMQNKMTKYIEAIPQVKKRGRPRKQQFEGAKASPMRLRTRAKNKANVDEPKITNCDMNSAPKEKKSQKPDKTEKSIYLLKQPKIILKNLTTKDVMSLPHQENENLRFEVKDSCSSPAIIIQPIQISEIRSSVDEYAGTSPQVKEKSPVVTSNTEEVEEQKQDSEEEEEEDPYDLCACVTSDKNDTMRCKKYVYIGPDNYVPNPSNDSFHNLSTSVMKLILDGQPHVLKVTDEIELFCSKQDSSIEKGKVKLIKNIPKKRNRKEHIEAYTKKLIKPASGKKVQECALKTSHVSEESDDNEYPSYTSTPVQPKVRVVFKESKMKIKSSTANCSKSSISSDGSGPVPSVDEDCVSSSTLAPVSSHAEQPAHTIKAEDINAVLSHLYGDDET